MLLADERGELLTAENSQVEQPSCVVVDATWSEVVVYVGLPGCPTTPDVLQLRWHERSNRDACAVSSHGGV